VVLVDLPADELLARLQGGKVYQAAQAERASQNFRKGNLIALRELALRRTADRIEGDVRAYRVEQSMPTSGRPAPRCWPASARAPTASTRCAARRAWPASSAPAGTRCTSRRRRCSGCRRAARADPAGLKLAEELGATTAVLAGQDIAATALEYARSHNLSKLVLGRAHRSAWQPGARRSAAGAVRARPRPDEIGAAHPPPRAGSLRLAPPRQDAWAHGAARAPGDRERRCRPAPGGAAGVTRRAAAQSPARRPPAWPPRWRPRRCWPTSTWPTSPCCSCWWWCWWRCATGAGRRCWPPAGVACFDFFFVPPRFSFAVSDVSTC
jgi:two-component system sensor histidine kinase KdpD